MTNPAYRACSMDKTTLNLVKGIFLYVIAPHGLAHMKVGWGREKKTAVI